MAASFISKLAKLVDNNGSKEMIKTQEDLIIESIDEIAKENDFYKLPTKEILEIIGRSNIEDVELLCGIVSKMNESKGKDSILLLNEINPENTTLEECVKIISSFKSSKFCRRIGKLFEENENSPEVDFQHEIGELKKQIEKQKKRRRKGIS